MRLDIDALSYRWPVEGAGSAHVDLHAINLSLYVVRGAVSRLYLRLRTVAEHMNRYNTLSFRSTDVRRSFMKSLSFRARWSCAKIEVVSAKSRWRQLGSEKWTRSSSYYVVNGGLQGCC